MGAKSVRRLTLLTFKYKYLCDCYIYLWLTRLAINGDNMLPGRAHIDDVPIAEFLITVGKSSPV